MPNDESLHIPIYHKGFVQMMCMHGIVAISFWFQEYMSLQVLEAKRMVARP